MTTFADWDLNRDINCYGKNITSLFGSPKIVGTFDCSYNKLKSLKGCPEKISGDFLCYHNELTSLEHCPKMVCNDFYCYGNKVKFTEREVRKRCDVGGNVYC